MIVCELAFKQPDPKRPGYSLHEVDYFDHGWRGRRGYRLSLRKNLKKDYFEVYRYHHDTGLEEVLFSGDFKDALQRAYDETKQVCGEEWGSPDQECQHKEPVISIFCPKWPAIRDKKEKS